MARVSIITPWLNASELVRTYTETAQRAQADAQKSGQERQQRVAELDNSLKSFVAIEAALGKVAGVPA